MMPAASYQIPGGSRVMVFTCEYCGAPAHHGIGVTLREALRTGDVTRAGHWYCSMDKHRNPVCGKGKA